jgi:hypothetical protein
MATSMNLLTFLLLCALFGAIAGAIPRLVR